MEYPQLKKLDLKYLTQKLLAFLNEDLPNDDLTTLCTVPKDAVVIAFFISEEDIVFAGSPIMQMLYSDDMYCKMYKKDGDYVKNGEIIAKIGGNARKILSLERITLNLIQRMSGIATLAKKYADIASPFNVKILDTRKTTPGIRIFEKYAVNVGGGYNHRLNLSEGILIKDNHIKAAGGVREAISAVKKNLRKDFKIEIEVENFDELFIALNEGIDGVLLDNMSPETIKEAVNIIRESPFGDAVFIEASGGINLDNLEEYVKTGIDAISSGALTHSVKNANIHLEFIDEKN